MAYVERFPYSSNVGAEGRALDGGDLVVGGNFRYAGTIGAMLSLCVYLAVLSVALSARFLSGRWRRIDATPAAPQLKQVLAKS